MRRLTRLIAAGGASALFTLGLLLCAAFLYFVLVPDVTPFRYAGF